MVVVAIRLRVVCHPGDDAVINGLVLVLGQVAELACYLCQSQASAPPEFKVDETLTLAFTPGCNPQR